LWMRLRLEVESQMGQCRCRPDCEGGWTHAASMTPATPAKKMLVAVLE